MQRVPLAFAIVLAAGAARAAMPSSGTLSDSSASITYASGPFFLSNPTAQATDTPTCSPVTPCDDFQLTVALPPDWKTAHPYEQVRVTIEWPANGVTDFDLYVFDASGKIVSQAATGNEPERAMFPATNGTYTLRVAPFTVIGDSFTARVELFTPPPPPGPLVAIDPGLPPRFQNYAAPGGKGTDAGEPSIGVNWKTGNVMYLAGYETLRVSFDDATSPARATWTDVSSQFTSLISLDPIGFTDPRTGRTFISQLVSGLGYGVGCSLTAYSDDDGETWVPSQGCGTPAGADHQTIGGGGYPSIAGIKPATPVYSNTVYYCSQAQATALCARSDDGGLTFGPGMPLYDLTQCSGLHGHVKVAPDGTVYVPNKNCGGKQGVVVSENGGNTWEIRTIPTSSGGASDPSVGIGANGTVYLGYQAADGHAHLAISFDRGRTWPVDADVGSMFDVQNTAFPAVVAGDDDRAAFTFLGTRTPGDFQGPLFDGDWYLYSVHTYNRGQSFSGANVTPGDPVQRGCIWLQGGSNPCRNLLDFTGAEIDAKGRVLVGYADGCIDGCVDGPPNTYSKLATIARQSGGRPLFRAFDPVEPRAPGAPLLSGTRTGSRVSLAWPAPDDGGSPLTGYRVYRGAASGSETLLASISAGKPAFEDSVVGPTPYYRVSAVNARGEGPQSNEVQPAETPPPPVYDPCTTPGVPVATDARGDQTGAPANEQADLLSLSIAEPYYPDGSTKLVFTIQVPQLNPLPPNVSWKVYFTTPDGVPRFISLDTFDPTAPRYRFGHTEPGAGGVSSNVDDGTIDPASNYTAGGTITLIVDASRIGSPAGGQTLAGVRATTQILVGATRGLLATADDTAIGSYRLAGRAACAPNAAPVAQLTASPTSGYAPLAVSFDASASSDPDAGDTIAEYRLDFGDGTSAAQAGSIFTHTYASAGTFTASLVVKDSRGKSSASAATVAITVANAPVAASEISGSGFLAGGPKFDLRVSSSKAGTFSYEDSVASLVFKTSSFDAYSRSGACVTFGGTATPDGGGQAVQFTAKACDNGSPGRNSDTFSLDVQARAYAKGGTLQGGNLKLK